MKITHNYQPFLFIGFFILISIYPIYQIINYGEFYFYQNAYDEYSYLAYNFAEHASEQGRFSSTIIVLLHNMGISGAIINLVFDLISLIFTYVFLSLILKKIFKNIDKNRIYFATLLIVFSPLLFNSANPVIAKLNSIFFSHDWIIYFITFAESIYLPIQRTPEPQFSILLLLAIVYLSIVLKRYWIPLLSIPFIYPFVAIPVLMMIGMYAVKKHFLKKRKFWQQLLISSVLIYIIVSVLLFFYFQFFMADKSMLAETHLPIIGLSIIWSVTIIIICQYIFPKTNLSNDEWFFIISLMISSILVLNTQIISGYITQPNHFEQIISLYIPALIFSIYYLRSKQDLNNILFVIIISALFLGILGHLRYVYKTNDVTVKQFDRLLKNTELKTILQTPTNITTGNYLLDSMITGFYNPKASMIMNYSNSYYGYFTKKYYCDYIALKQKIRIEHGNVADIENSFSVLDNAYKYLNLDHVLLHMNRRSSKEFVFECGKEEIKQKFIYLRP